MKNSGDDLTCLGNYFYDNGKGMFKELCAETRDSRCAKYLIWLFLADSKALMGIKF